MNYLKATDGSRRLTGVVATVLVHVVLLYALIAGSALKVVEVVREPFETRILVEPKPPPAEPLPPVRAPQPPSRAAPGPMLPRPLVHAGRAPTPRVPPAPAPHAAPVPTTPASPLPYAPAPEVPVPTGEAAETISTTQVPTPSAGHSAAPVGSQGTAGRGAAAPAASVQLEGCVTPEYPAASLQAEESGTVSLSFLVSADGQVLESRIDKSSGYRRLDEAARRALARCRFRPAIVDGKPRQSWAHINYVWRIE